MATETIFDAASTDLRGRLVIEASAGTGKTWSLSRIVMRLVAEEGFPIGSILLVTFTKAATEELKSRVKELLAEASDALAGLDDWPDNHALAPEQADAVGAFGCGTLTMFARRVGPFAALYRLGACAPGRTQAPRRYPYV